MPEPIDTQAAVNLRAWAEREREQTPELAGILEGFAADGLPRLDECKPWEQLRDEHYERLGIVVDSWHVA
ncbi:hypothetical protein ACH4GK_32005 [Streptomyces rimosus]|uniref:hypothetical protein n=1 Tax=Streptomyces rimosus TaxID=1927 RepID=UPI0004CC4DCD|nr:hypothetical protein [Streptomyces rimosus]